MRESRELLVDFHESVGECGRRAGWDRGGGTAERLTDCGTLLRMQNLFVLFLHVLSGLCVVCFSRFDPSFIFETIAFHSYYEYDASDEATWWELHNLYPNLSYSQQQSLHHELVDLFACRGTVFDFFLSCASFYKKLAFNLTSCDSSCPQEQETLLRIAPD